MSGSISERSSEFEDTTEANICSFPIYIMFYVAGNDSKATACRMMLIV